MRTYYSMLQSHEAPDAVGKMKQFATYFTHGVRNGSKLRVEIYRSHEAAAILDLVDRFFERELEAVPA
jgi:tRNA-dihydrouridine synthase